MNKMDLVRACYEDVIKDLNETQSEYEPRMPHTTEIIRDWKCCAAEEWEDLTVEEVDVEFDRLYEIVEKESTEAAMAYA